MVVCSFDKLQESDSFDKSSEFNNFYQKNQTLGVSGYRLTISLTNLNEFLDYLFHSRV